VHLLGDAVAHQFDRDLIGQLPAGTSPRGRLLRSANSSSTSRWSWVRIAITSRCGDWVMATPWFVDAVTRCGRDEYRNPTDSSGRSIWCGDLPLGAETVLKATAYVGGSTKMLLLIALLLVLLFGGLGFVAHILWLGLILGLIVAVAHVVSGGLTRSRRPRV
jgi:hypothetical protein